MRLAVSIVMPVYNEEQVIEKVVKQYHAQVIGQIQGSEFIIVNDNSTDGTGKILERLAQDLPGISVINLEKNGGHGLALQEGFRRVKNPLVFHVDSDNQFKAEEFWKLYALCGNNDIVLGWRKERHDSLKRKIVSGLLRIALMIVFGIRAEDANSPFKCIRTEALRDVMPDLPPRPFAISVLILALAKSRGYRVKEVPVTHFARTTGKSKLSSAFFLFQSCFFCFRDILVLKIKMKKGIFSRK